jgi:type IV secretion system protein VirD4
MTMRREVVFFADETASYKTLDCLIAAYGTARAFGVKLWTFWTDVGAMEELYPRGRYKSFLANSAVTIWLGTKEISTAKHISEQSGMKDVIMHSRNVNYGYALGGVPAVSDSKSQGHREVVTVRDAMDLPANEALLVVRGIPGIVRVSHKKYFEQRRLRGRYDKNPLYEK